MYGLEMVKKWSQYFHRDVFYLYVKRNENEHLKEALDEATASCFPANTFIAVLMIV